MVASSELRGRYLVVYFYPKDNTPGCTTEALDFSRVRDDLDALGCSVLGISKDSVASHEKFATKHDLDLPLLSDPELAAHRAYGAFGEKTMYGKKVQGTIRSTFIVDPSGHVAFAQYGVKVAGHAEAIVDEVSRLRGEVSRTRVVSRPKKVTPPKKPKK